MGGDLAEHAVETADGGRRGGPVPALLVGVGLVPRTLFEEDTLRAELPGYAAYTERVKYRWVPGVW